MHRTRYSTGANPAAHVASDASTPDSSPLRVVICGSFRKGIPELRDAFEQLQSQFVVLSPLGLDFVDPDDTFVRLPHELNQLASDIERRHLDAITEADFVWLHAPDGYIGASAMFELGHARALGIPVFASTPPAEEVHRSWVSVVASPSEITIEQDLKAPGNGLRGLQHYYERTAYRRGWGHETVQDTLLLMTEEMGELARAIRKSLGIARDGEWYGEDVAEELADVQLYLVHLANSAGIDLAEAVTNKEAVNAARSAQRSGVA